MSTATATATNPATDEFRDILLRTLQLEPEPANASQISKRLTGQANKTPQEVEAALKELVEAGQAFHFPKLSGKVRYWCKPMTEYIDLELLRVLGDHPYSKSDVHKKLAKRLSGVPKPEINKHIDELVRQAKLKKWPKQVGCRTDFFCVRTVEPDFYAKYALEKVVEKLKPQGLDKEAVRAAFQKITESWAQPETAPAIPVSPIPVIEVPTASVEATDDTEPNLEELILERMIVVEPRAAGGALVSITELRNSLEFQQIPKRDFDEAVLRLRRAWQVSLDEHPHLASLSAEVLEKLVHDGQGHYFQSASRCAEGGPNHKHVQSVSWRHRFQRLGIHGGCPQRFMRRNFRRAAGRWITSAQENPHDFGADPRTTGRGKNAFAQSAVSAFARRRCGFRSIRQCLVYIL